MHIRFVDKNSSVKVYFSILQKFLIIIRPSEARGRINGVQGKTEAGGSGPIKG